MATLAVVGHAAAVTQLVGNAFGLICKIKRAVETACQNKLECELIARRVPTINGVLSSLPQEPEVVGPLKELNSTLQEAHDMVVACRDRSHANLFFRSRRHAECFTQVNLRIMSDISVLNLCLLNIIARQQTTKMATEVPSSVSCSGYPRRNHMVVVPDCPRMFTLAEISAATNNFAVELGGGCSGKVYKGHLCDGPEVAVKVLDKHGRQDVEHAFVTELEILFPLHHDHIVRLVGWYTEEKDPMFVYEHEHMSNGTLRDHLVHVGLRTRMRVRLSGGFSSTPARVCWRTRVEVLLGVSRAVEHLHCSGIIHLDVSSSNILLDATWTLRLSGFGAAVLQAPAVAGQVVEEVVGTPGYLDPEYLDVYSFGVVMLEALTGEDPATLQLDSSLMAIRDGKLRDVLDRRPATLPQFEALELVAHTAERCLYPRGKGRPSMPDVVASLEKALRMILIS
ncbi:putative serine/threonine-protein kinase-like protein CCR3 [Triticum dicoccoides]|uniref:putative serine/threonine-protein kinase-like protein CCR3 n=1 Tax=Triticum dicoccoides TaxID=85692 RepID=UPI00188E5B10|nr:putative serine/threonine-protein kinase-like protein CCR3 [Triticum dicoccoides]